MAPLHARPLAAPVLPRPSLTFPFTPLGLPLPPPCPLLTPSLTCHRGRVEAPSLCLGRCSPPDPVWSGSPCWTSALSSPGRHLPGLRAPAQGRPPPPSCWRPRKGLPPHPRGCPDPTFPTASPAHGKVAGVSQGARQGQTCGDVRRGGTYLLGPPLRDGDGTVGRGRERISGEPERRLRAGAVGGGGAEPERNHAGRQSHGPSCPCVAQTPAHPHTCHSCARAPTRD